MSEKLEERPREARKNRRPVDALAMLSWGVAPQGLAVPRVSTEDLSCFSEDSQMLWSRDFHPADPSAEMRLLPAAATLELRQRVLRPHQSVNDVRFPNDEAVDSRHFGVFVHGCLVGIASLCRELEPLELQPKAERLHAERLHAERQARGDWRLRGMATLPEVRGQGYGKELVHACLRHARAEGGIRLWCNARVSALGFYEALGFVARGSEFAVPEAGPHVRMHFDLTG